MKKLLFQIIPIQKEKFSLFFIYLFIYYFNLGLSYILFNFTFNLFIGIYQDNK